MTSAAWPCRAQRSHKRWTPDAPIRGCLLGSLLKLTLGKQISVLRMFNHYERGSPMSDVTTVGIDLAKNVFSVHGVEAEGAVVLRRSVGRAKLLELIAQLSPCLIGMEACSGAHDWARRFSRFGHRVRLMAPKFVAPYRKSGKNDGNDAETICEAVTRPSMRFVPVKSLEQQADLCLHRARQGFVEERTSTINCLRGLLAEFGHVLPQRAVEVRRQVPALIEQLPARAARCIADLIEHVRELEAKIAAFEREIETHARHSTLAQRAQARQGIGPITASAFVATVGNAERATVRRLARTRATAIFDRRQDPPRPHHASRRRLPADAARDGGTIRAATCLART
jgi:transposase